MANALIQHPTDNRIGTATVTIDSGTEDPAYPIGAGIKNTSPGKWGKFTTNTGAFVMNFGSAVAVPVFGLPLYKIDAGATVKIQANTSSSWGSPPLDVTITIPTHRLNGFPHGRLKDLSSLTHTYQYWRFAVTGGNTAPVQVGWLWMGATKRTLIQNIRWEEEEIDEQPQITHETDFLWETHYPFGTSRTGITGEIRTQQSDGAEEQYKNWMDAAGMSEYHLFSLDPDTEHCRLVRHSEPWKFKRNTWNDKHIQVRLLERSLGLRP